MQPPCVLTVAGSDSGGGAGIQADLKSIMMQGGYGLSVVTALTAQNTRGVTAIEAPTPGFVAEQLRVVLADFPIRAAKTGMLFSEPIIDAVVWELAGKTFPLVVDPVCVAQSGANLLLPEAVEALKSRLFPLAELVTPNRHEAELLAGMTIASPEDAVEAMRRLLDLGPRAVLLKGGHFEARDAAGRPVRTDWLLSADGELREYVRPHVPTVHTHGTGCTLSAAIAAHLALGKPLPLAVEAARDFLQLALRGSYPLGGGEGPVHHLMPFLRQADRLDVLEKLARVGGELGAMPGHDSWLPAGGGQLAMAVPLASEAADVAALDLTGRSGGPLFGVAGEAGRLLLAFGDAGLPQRCLVTLRYAEDVVAALGRVGIAAVPITCSDGVPGGAPVVDCGRGVTLSDLPPVGAVWERDVAGREPHLYLFGPDTTAVLDRLRTLCAVPV